MKPDKMLKDLAKKKEPHKRRINLYVDKYIYEQFQEKCKGIPVSKVVEKMMEEFVLKSKKD